MFELRLLGCGLVKLGQQERNVRPGEMVLLAYLALQRGRPVARETVAADLWPDVPEERSRRRLNTALWRLRREMGEPADQLLRGNGNGQLALDMSRVHLDVLAFEGPATAIGLCPGDQITVDDVERLRSALSHYRGDLLAGYDGEWILTERERLLRLYLTASARLMALYQQNERYQAAIAVGNAILDRDPLREEVHGEVIRCFGRLGERAQAIDQYDRLSGILDGELGLEPTRDITAFVTSLRDPARRGSEGPSLDEPVDLYSSLLEMVAQLERLTGEIGAAIAQLRASPAAAAVPIGPADDRGARDRLNGNLGSEVAGTARSAAQPV